MSNRNRLFLAAVVLALLGGLLVFNGREVAGIHRQQGALERALAVQRRQTLKLCQFNADLGNVAATPVTLNPSTHKATKLGIAIIADSRAAWRGLNCPGTLRPPGKSFRHWAETYGLPYR